MAAASPANKCLLQASMTGDVLGAHRVTQWMLRKTLKAVRGAGPRHQPAAPHNSPFHSHETTPAAPEPASPAHLLPPCLQPDLLISALVPVELAHASEEEVQEQEPHHTPQQHTPQAVQGPAHTPQHPSTYQQPEQGSSAQQQNQHRNQSEGPWAKSQHPSLQVDRVMSAQMQWLRSRGVTQAELASFLVQAQAQAAAAAKVAAAGAAAVDEASHSVQVDGMSSTAAGKHGSSKCHQPSASPEVRQSVPHTHVNLLPLTTPSFDKSQAADHQRPAPPADRPLTTPSTPAAAPKQTQQEQHQQPQPQLDLSAPSQQGQATHSSSQSPEAQHHDRPVPAPSKEGEVVEIQPDISHVLPGLTLTLRVLKPQQQQEQQAQQQAQRDGVTAPHSPLTSPHSPVPAMCTNPLSEVTPGSDQWDPATAITNPLFVGPETDAAEQGGWVEGREARASKQPDQQAQGEAASDICQESDARPGA